MGEIVGVFYNKTKVSDPPKTLDDFEASLKEAKADGDIPIQFGNLDAWPGIHEYETVLAQTADKQAVRDFVFAREGASFDTPEFQAAAEKLQQWVDDGYFTPDFNGTGYDPAWQRFAKGKGRYLIAGTWLIADLADQMGDDVGFMLMPGTDEGADPVALGGESLPFVDHVAVQEQGRCGRVHRLPDRRQRGDGAGGDGQPPRHAGRRGVDRGRAAARRSSRSGRGSTRPTASSRTWTTRPRRSSTTSAPRSRS